MREEGGKCPAIGRHFNIVFLCYLIMVVHTVKSNKGCVDVDG